MTIASHPTRRRLAAAALTALLGAVPSLSQAQIVPPPPWQREGALVRLGYETVRLPGDEAMGLVSSSYLLEVRPGLCAGPGVYSAVSGLRGGLFVVGAEAALCTRLSGRLSVRAGLFVGGGGGGGAPVGGGLMLRPHADLLWDFGTWRAGVSLSNVNFPTGDINSTQFGLMFETGTGITYLPAARDSAPYRGGSGIGVDRFVGVASAYLPSAATVSTAGVPLQSRIGLIGARAERFFMPGVYAGLESNGAASGGVAGYAEFLGTLGVEREWPGGFGVGARLALGMGGGGGMPVGGGLLAKASLSAAWRVTRDLSLSLEGGWVSAPQGDFSAPSAAIALRWDLAPQPGQPSALARQELAGGIELLQSAARIAGPPQSLQSVSFKFNRFVGESVYLSAQTQSAYLGDAGAFAIGLFGIGAQWRFGAGWRYGAEMLAGAAGGGGVDTGNGAVLKPMLYVGYDIGPSMYLRAGAGRIVADTGLDSNVFELSLVFAYSVDGRR